MTFALVFPGQGSQRPGMFDAFASDEAAATTFEEAASILGYDPRECDDEKSLESTVHVQIGLFLCGIASARALESRGSIPSLVAGHSVGAFSAAVVSASVSFEEALRALIVRARTMEALFPSGYGMAVCAGIAQAQVREIVDRIRHRGGVLYVANVNAPAQTVVSGTLDAIDAAIEAFQCNGARRAERLTVNVPSHCTLMQPAADAVRKSVARTTFAAPHRYYVSSMRAAAVRDGSGVRDDLCDGVAHEVRWEAAARLIEELGTQLAVEAIPGRVLTDLWQGERLRAEPMDGAKIDSTAALARRFLPPAH